jgi:DNA-binding NarL/FixJ family response regulator
MGSSLHLSLSSPQINVKVTMSNSVNGPCYPCFDALTPSELKVIRLVADGLTNKSIAAALHLSRFTVETHLKHVFVKVGVSSRAALAAHAVRRDLRQRQDT